MSKKIFSLTVFTTFFIVMTAGPQKGMADEGSDTVSVEMTGEGRIPLRGNVSQARKIAIMLAKRNAVERGVGASVSLSMVPGKREVLLKAEGTVEYSILEVGQK